MFSLIGWQETPGERIAKLQRTKEREARRLTGGGRRDSIPALQEHTRALEAAIKKAISAGDRPSAMRMAKELRVVREKIKIAENKVDRTNEEILRMMQRGELVSKAETARSNLAIDSSIVASISPAEITAIDYFSSMREDEIGISEDLLNELVDPSEESKTESDDILTEFTISTLDGIHAPSAGSLSGRLPSVPSSTSLY